MTVTGRVVLVVVLALLAGGVVLVGSLADNKPDRSRTAQSATPDATGSATAADLVVIGTGSLSGDAEGLVVGVPLLNRGGQDAVVRGVTGLPTQFDAALPESGLAVAAGKRGTLLLRWAGPDCSAEAPERVLPDVQLTGRVSGPEGSDVELSTAAVDQLLRQAWRTACTVDDGPDTPYVG